MGHSDQQSIHISGLPSPGITSPWANPCLESAWQRSLVSDLLDVDGDVEASLPAFNNIDFNRRPQHLLRAAVFPSAGWAGAPCNQDQGQVRTVDDSIAVKVVSRA